MEEKTHRIYIHFHPLPVSTLHTRYEIIADIVAFSHITEAMDGWMFLKMIGVNAF